MPRRVALAIAGLVGSILIATLGALGYALSGSNTTGQAPVIADNVVEEKTSAAGQNDSGEERNEQGASTSWSDQPKKVRSVTIRPEIGAVDTLAAESSLNARSELNASAMLRARPNVDDQVKARTSAARAQVPARNGEIVCQSSPGRGGYWAWRIVDSRKCWYEGKVGMSKNNLRWVRVAR